MWKGLVRLGDRGVPVKLYAAVEEKTVHFHLLNARTGHPVKQRMIHPLTGDVVDSADVRRGYEVEEGFFVILEEGELEPLQPEKSREIRVSRFLEPGLINHQWYDRPYHLGPDGDAEAYFALVDALKAESKEGLAHWTMRNKEYNGALRVEEDHLMMITLRHAEEVIAASSLPAPSGRPPQRPELRMARQLVSAMEVDFDPTRYQDEYRGRVLALIESKASGKTITFRPPRKKGRTENLAASLKASIKAVKERRSA